MPPGVPREAPGCARGGRGGPIALSPCNGSSAWTRWAQGAGPLASRDSADRGGPAARRERSPGARPGAGTPGFRRGPASRGVPPREWSSMNPMDSKLISRRCPSEGKPDPYRPPWADGPARGHCRGPVRSPSSPSSRVISLRRASLVGSASRKRCRTPGAIETHNCMPVPFLGGRVSRPSHSPALRKGPARLPSV